MAETFAKMADQALDHTIYLVGWKIEETSGMPVWIARNSYGDKWGMTGDFYVRMGHDDFGIESEVSGYEVEYLLS
jgi:C1A family cysteine protease